MTQHEIVNDVVGGQPLVVTYCPLCNSGLAFERTVDGQVLDFGTSGRLFQANLVMYDRQSKTLWTQFTGRAVVGEAFVGTELVRVPTGLLAWDDFESGVPDGMVLSPESEPGRDYGRNPYTGYEDSGDQFLFDGDRDDRLPPNSRVVGLGTDRDPVAITLDHLSEEAVVEVEVDGSPVTVLWAPGQSSALDRATVDEGRDVGSTGAFVPVSEDGTELTFAPLDEDDGTFRDDQTGSTWNCSARRSTASSPACSSSPSPATTPSGSCGSPSSPRPPSSARRTPMRDSRRVAALLTGLAVTLAACGGDATGDQPDASSDSPTASASPSEPTLPDIEVDDFAGNATSLHDHVGTPMVVNFWASWCPPCIAEMPDLEAVHQMVADEVTFIGINTQDTDEQAEALRDETGVSYELLRDPDGALFQAFGVFGMPSTFYVDADGTIVDRHTGLLTRDALLDDLRVHLGIGDEVTS